MTTLLDAALTYAARGWPVFPIAPGTKVPLIPGHAGGRGVLDATTEIAQIEAWWAANPDANIGLATGAPGPDVLDVDVKTDGNGWDAFGELRKAGLADDVAIYVSTPSGGLHAYYTGSTQRNGRIPGKHIDYRGAGGYVLAPPSVVDGKTYVGDTGGVLGAQCDWRAIRALLDPPPDPPQFTQPSRGEPNHLTDQLLPGADYQARTTWQQILTPHGWRQTRDLGGGRALWTRPGKTWGTSATTREDGGLYVFSTSTPFDPEIPYTRFGAYAVLEHGGNHQAAAAALRLAGYGQDTTSIASVPKSAREPDSVQLSGQDVAAPELEHTSWWPRDLDPILDGDTSADPPPSLLERDDGHRLIYAGKINALIGESESGKTWIALLAAVQALNAGELVVYLDFEDAPAGITGRLLAMGATRPQLAKQLRYIAPDESLHVRAAADLAAALDPPPGLVVVDGVNAAMTLLGLNLKDNKDATDFSQRILRPLKRTGAAVLTVDHTTKDKEQRGNYAIGAQAKRADIDGAAFIIEVIKAFGRGQTGRLKMTVSKDRPGHVRANSQHAKYAGTAVLESREDGTVTVSITAPDSHLEDTERAPFRPTGLMQRVSEFLAATPGGASKHAIELAIRGRAEYVRQALAILIQEGWVTAETGPNRTVRCVLTRPYSESAELQIPGSSIVPSSSPVRPDQPVSMLVGSSPSSSPLSPVGREDERDEPAVTPPVPDPGSSLAAKPLELGPCDSCGVPIIKYGPRSIGRLCGDCKRNPGDAGA